MHTNNLAYMYCQMLIVDCDGYYITLNRFYVRTLIGALKVLVWFLSTQGTLSFKVSKQLVSLSFLMNPYKLNSCCIYIHMLFVIIFSLSSFTSLRSAFFLLFLSLFFSSRPSRNTGFSPFLASFQCFWMLLPSLS